jgi:RNA polymerase sigma-70 factor (ECF subfamily)
MDNVLDAARAGDEGAFRELVEPRRAELRAHCYRMLGSVQEAEDVLQDALLRIWRGLPRFEGRSSLRVWMYRVTTNACLASLGRQSRRPLPVDLRPPGDPYDGTDEPDTEVPWLEPYTGPDASYEQTEDVELAFVAALQHLLPNERATLLLREVLGFSARETAEQLGTTVASVTSALQRARTRVDGRLPAPSQREVQRSLGEQRVRTLVERYMDAMRRADVPAVVALLTEDVTWSMPPFGGWYHGIDAVPPFLERYPFQQRWRHLPIRANGQAAVACYMWIDEVGAYVAHVVDVLTLSDDDRIAAITAFIDPAHVLRTGLPAQLPA